MVKEIKKEIPQETSEIPKEIFMGLGLEAMKGKKQEYLLKAQQIEKKIKELEGMLHQAIGIYNFLSEMITIAEPKKKSSNGKVEKK